MVMKCKNFALSIVFLSAVGIQGMDTQTHHHHKMNLDNIHGVTLTRNHETGNLVLTPRTSKDHNQHYNAKTGEWTEQNSSLQTAGIGIGGACIPIAAYFFGRYIGQQNLGKILLAGGAVAGSAGTLAWGAQVHPSDRSRNALIVGAVFAVPLLIVGWLNGDSNKNSW